MRPFEKSTLRDALLNRTNFTCGSIERTSVCTCYVQGQSFTVVSLGCSPTEWRI